MLTIAEVIAIYAEYDVIVSEREAAETLRYASQANDNPTIDTLIARVHGFAQQESLDNIAEGRAAEEFEENYR